LEILFVVLWFLIIVRRQCIEEVFIGHGCLTFLIHGRSKLIVDLLWSSKESNLIFSVTPGVILLRWLGSKC
jgi:hypothetical protein